MSIFTALWGHLGLTDEERQQTQNQQAQAVQQREEAHTLNTKASSISVRNNFGQKLHVAMHGRLER